MICACGSGEHKEYIEKQSIEGNKKSGRFKSKIWNREQTSYQIYKTEKQIEDASTVGNWWGISVYW